jgi:hypothetical protein
MRSTLTTSHLASADSTTMTKYRLRRRLRMSEWGLPEKIGALSSARRRATMRTRTRYI